ncbi:zinc finger protein 260-like [Dendronephthya gigantea]|uniref:zinc finger protein 260-like n=1 Tax=Dendronephthya gigantea TaxID=151771 RepID=UPI00106A748F|nr:zinc finger protein 260-like [Dendronephthya gigantea]
MATEETYMMSDEQLLEKAPMSAAMHPNANVISTADAMETEDSGEDELDLHVCGKCKAEFTSIENYVEHKRVSCSKRTPVKNQESPSKGRKLSESPAKQVIRGTDNVTAILEPQVQGFCETVIEEGGIVVEAQDSEAHQEIIKAARASESQSLPIEKSKEKEPTTTVELEQGEIDPTASASTRGENGSFKCGICNSDFDRPETLVVHQLMHKKFHQCCDCKRSFVNLENLNKHKKDFKHVFKCKICQEEFPSQDICKSHAASHTRQHECQDCKKKFFTEKSLLRHREKVLHNLPCDKCDKVCRDKHALTKHQESHLRVKSHVCDWEGCDRGFRSACELLKHKKCVHLGIKEFKCTECGREFSRKDKLNRHILIHSPNRPTYPCPFKTFTGCQKTFYRKDKLQRHIFAHSKEKPYKCKTCNKVFARKDNLTEHTRIHTGEFKHRCPVCNKGMGGPKKLLLHMQQKHSGVNEVIPEKPTMVSESVLLATSQAATVVSPVTTTTTTESADASAASWVQQNITGEKTGPEAEATPAVASPASVSAMSEDFQPEQEQRGPGEGRQPIQEVTNDIHHQQQQQDVHQQQQPEMHHQQEPEMHHQQPEVHDQQTEHDSGSLVELQHHQTILHHHQEASQNPPQVALRPLMEHQEQQQPNMPQQIIIQPQTMIITPPQGSPPRVSVHYLSSNTTSQPQTSYASTLQQNVPSVTQSDTVLLHEVLSELATRSLFNS